MAFIATVPPSRATGETAEAYRYMREVVGTGRAAQIIQLFSLRPASMRRMIRSWELSNWAGSEPRAPRELVAAAVSRLNDCHY
jgi:alkylhydroperoxidase family enzyme